MGPSSSSLRSQYPRPRHPHIAPPPSPPHQHHPIITPTPTTCLQFSADNSTGGYTLTDATGQVVNILEGPISACGSELYVIDKVGTHSPLVPALPLPKPLCTRRRRCRTRMPSVAGRLRSARCLSAPALQVLLPAQLLSIPDTDPQDAVAILARDTAGAAAPAPSA